MSTIKDKKNEKIVNFLKDLNLLDLSVIEELDLEERKRLKVFQRFERGNLIDISSLDSRESEVYMSRMVEGMSLDEVGNEINVSRERVRRIFKEANDKVRRKTLETLKKEVEKDNN